MDIGPRFYHSRNALKKLLVPVGLMLFAANCFATAKLELEIEVSDQALYFDGEKKSVTQARNEPYIEGQKYNYAYGRSIVPHGDAIKAYKDYIFMTWYRGGILDRHMMLTRYNTKTGAKVDIEFPHQHTGFEGRWWVGETHNTIAVGISPKDETIHLLFDMHAYSPGKDTGGNGSFKHDYFRYAYSLPGAASVEDDKFTLAQFVKDTGANSEGPNDYNHVTMTGVENVSAFQQLTYPGFFLNDQNDLLMHMRQGTSHDGGIVFNRYLPEQSKWTNFQRFNVLKAQSKGEIDDWSIYGHMKYQDGKIRIGFQRRLNRPDKFYANEGMHYAYSDDPTGATEWKNYKGELITMPLVKADEVLVFDQSTLMPEATGRDQVSITGGFDFAVTDKGDVHMIGRASERVNGKNIRTIYSHHYQKDGVGEFVTSTDFPSASEIYAAGDNIYIIGLDNGRPFVQQALGGTNNFTKVYEAPVQSKTFEKGVVYIYDGKVYYYLLEGGSGDTRTTHLQVIDLDIQPSSPEGFSYAAKQGETVQVTGTMDIAFGANENFTYLTNQTQNVTCDAASFSVAPPDSKFACFTVDVTPSIAFTGDSLTLLEGYETIAIKVDANTPVANRNITVDLYINEIKVSSDAAVAHEWTQTSPELQNLAPGSYSLKAVVTDDTGLSVQTTSNLTIKAKPTPAISFANETLALEKGYETILVKVNPQISSDTASIAQVSLVLNNKIISTDSEAPYQWDLTTEELGSLSIGTHTLIAALTDSNGTTSEASMTVTVSAKPTPTPTQDKESEGGGSFGFISLLALIALAGRRKVIK
ncbi:BNR-4 repeat-containing protein [Catenovulum maritimum]|uniref:BNR-4 repeat-containing protein n=1 Tax=Catenovulum maritimum TaxID=1513271 RepID=UPI00098EE056|nr:BNR-4 repeat-containing protein [Catenovulum maritimum]